MNEDTRKKLRDALMDTFRSWGGQWNVSPVAPGTGAAPDDRWLIRVHSNPITRAELPADLVDSYLQDPDNAETTARWETELRPIFDQARAQAP